MNNFHKVNVSVLPVRSEASHKAEMSDELLYGEVVDLISINEKWANISCTDYNYSGWVPSDALSKCDNTSANYKILTDFAGQIELDGKTVTLPRGSRITDEKIICGNFEKIENKLSAENIIRAAYSYINSPYRWGGRSPWGIDCSGFVFMTYLLCGKQLPRDASQQVLCGTNVEFIQNAQTADVAFFGNSEEEITHTGILLSENKIIHSSGKVRIDMIDHEGIYNSEKSYYTHKLRAIKRLI